jgi:hypothetical protein
MNDLTQQGRTRGACASKANASSIKVLTLKDFLTGFSYTSFAPNKGMGFGVDFTVFVTSTADKIPALKPPSEPHSSRMISRDH